MRTPRAASRVLAVLAVLVGISVLAVGPAAAHNVLISSNPADGATLHTIPNSVTFTFDQPVQNFDPVVSVTGPDGRTHQTGAAEINGNVVSNAVSLGPAGAYVAAFRIVSSDGHPVTGEIHFTVAAGAAPAAGGSAAGSGAAVAPSTAAADTSSVAATPVATGSAGLSAWLWIGLVVAALVIAAAVVLLLRKPQR